MAEGALGDLAGGREPRKIDGSEAFIDASFARAEGGGPGVGLTQLRLDLCLCGKPANLIGDRAYDSYPLDAELHEQGV